MQIEPRRPTPAGPERLVPVREPAEGAYTLWMPEGWANQAHLQREHGLNRIIATATRPDRGAMIHIGDPRLPLFMEPSPYLDPMLAGFNPHICYQPFTPADRFFPDYVGRCFGPAPGFRLVSVDPTPGFHRLNLEAAQGQPGAIVTTAAVAFEHAMEGRPMLCRLHGATIRAQVGWMVNLVISSAVDDLAAVDALALRVVASRKYNPAWQAAQQRLHEQKMMLGAQQLQHIHAMTAMQAQGHQQRMAGIRAFGQANTQMHHQRMAQSDAMHGSWLADQAQADSSHQAWMHQQHRDDAMQQARVNGIREEHTVADAAGNTYQVAGHHERYYVNKRDDSYIGTGATVEQADLGRAHGVNPDDYEEVRIVR
jgi:hypothetical protein